MGSTYYMTLFYRIPWDNIIYKSHVTGYNIWVTERYKLDYHVQFADMESAGICYFPTFYHNSRNPKVVFARIENDVLSQWICPYIKRCY